MVFRMPPIVGVVALVCTGLGLLFQIIGVATNGWLTVGNADIGLWEICFQDNCSKIDPAADYLEACRAFGILGVLVLVGAAVMGVLMFFTESSKIYIIAALLDAVAGVMILIEFAVYAGETIYTDFAYSFALTIVAWLLAWAGAACFFLCKILP